MPIDHSRQSSPMRLNCTSRFLTLRRRRYEVERGRYEYLNATQGENIRATSGGRAGCAWFIDYGASRR